jgi:hypothetical protein
MCKANSQPGDFDANAKAVVIGSVYTEMLIWLADRQPRRARASFAAADQKHRFGRDPNETFRHAAEE